MQIIIKMNYFCLRKKNYLRTFIMKDLIEELTVKSNFDYLSYIVESSGNETNFTGVEDPMVFLNDIKIGKLRLEEVKENYKKILINS